VAGEDRVDLRLHLRGDAGAAVDRPGLRGLRDQLTFDVLVAGLEALDEGRDRGVIGREIRRAIEIEDRDEVLRQQAGLEEAEDRVDAV